MRRLLSASVVLCGLFNLAAAGVAVAAPAVDAAQLTLYFNRGGLAQWDVSLDASGGGDAGAARKHPADYRVLIYAERADSARGGAADMRFEGTLQFAFGGRRLRLQPIAVSPLPGQRAVAFVDARGQPLLLAEMGHRMPPHNERVEWRNLDLRVLPELARRLGRPALAGQFIGAMDLELAVAREPSGSIGALHAKGQRNCRSQLQWPSATAPADLALVDISQIFAMRCNGCGVASTDGQVVFAPNAELGNVGAADISWNPKFSAPSPPYGNDQHPFLVWNLYRVDATGRLDQIGASGVKHAFFAQNNDCDCIGDVILYRTCTDLYSAFTNDSVDDLGPRREIIPYTAQWGRCGSIYDQNCDGSFDPGSGVGGAYAERLVAIESDLLPTSNPGASYYFEAWYVVREDAQLDNSMGNRAVLPEKNGSAWTMSGLSVLTTGPVVERWAPRTAPGLFQHGARATTADGRVQLGARVTRLPNGRYRYDYALMNLDFARTTTLGAEPNLRVLTHTGLAGLLIPYANATAVDSLEFGDGDHDGSNDWAGNVSATQVGWSAAAGHTQTWGRLYRFALVADAGPQLATAGVILDPAQPLDRAEIAALIPGAAGFLFADDYE